MTPHALWVCNTNLKCTYDDEAFKYLSEKVLNCGALVFGTPVHWRDTSSLVRYFMLKMSRIYARSGPLSGLPGVAIAIAGGTGNGRSLGYASSIVSFRPCRSEHWNRCRPPASTSPRLSNAAANLVANWQRWRSRASFSRGWKNASCGMTRCRISTWTARANADCWLISPQPCFPRDADPEIAGGLARADALLAAGRKVEALTEVTRVYNTGFKLFGERGAAGKAG